MNMPLITPEDFAEKLNVSRKTFTALRRRESRKENSDFPKTIYLSARLFRWEESDVDAYIEARKERGNDYEDN